MPNIGRIIYGFCSGFFGRDSYDDKRIEAEGYDWIVARAIDRDGHEMYIQNLLRLVTKKKRKST